MKARVPTARYVGVFEGSPPLVALGEAMPLTALLAPVGAYKVRKRAWGRCARAGLGWAVHWLDWAGLGGEGGGEEFKTSASFAQPKRPHSLSLPSFHPSMLAAVKRLASQP